ncbi:MAG: hypothetical protein SAJ12_05845 [Jaaginema sp. PMC 1079.18]|nr:hypothetical protein [Jaaginema sp. PMC 1080.18]MEC4850513.1 hypothetical protein [Jaaginema sp. PMC 1079.18]MEC4864770.1 hypothetical protein [Jaaginema sp. PMC 1078.18]
MFAEIAFLLLPVSLHNLNPNPIPVIQWESGWVRDTPPTLSQPETSPEAVEDEPDTNNLLINKTGQNVVYLGVFLLAVTVVATIGILSHRLVWAVIFALILTAVLIAFLWFV